MNKKAKIFVIIVLCLILIFLLAILSYSIYMKKTYISKDSVKEIVLNDTKLSKKDVTFKEIDLDADDGLHKYEVEFYYNKAKYKYEVDAKNGKIIYSDFKNQNNDNNLNNELLLPEIIENTKKSALGTEGFNLIEAAKMAYQLEQMRPNSLIKSNSSVCFSLQWLYVNDYFDKGNDDNYTGSALIDFNNINKNYNYLFWLSDGEYAYNKESLNDYGFQDAVFQNQASNDCDNQGNIMCFLKEGNSYCDYK